MTDRRSRRKSRITQQREPRVKRDNFVFASLCRLITTAALSIANLFFRASFLDFIGVHTENYGLLPFVVTEIVLVGLTVLFYVEYRRDKILLTSSTDSTMKDRREPTSDGSSGGGSLD